MDSLKQTSISKIVFFMVACTVCYLAVVGKMSVEQFMNIVTLVFGSYYVGKASENRNIPNEQK